MIYLDNVKETFYIPKSSARGGNNIRFINGFTKDVLDISINAYDIYYKLTDNRVHGLADGQYVYEIYTDNNIYDSGIAQKGLFVGADSSIYGQKINFIQYEG